ncbi:MAG: 3'-5' exonuclease [Eubacteriales bacterium]
MKIIVFDLEWNQAANGKKDTVEEIPFEIIEIGAVKLNNRRKIISEYNEVIKPVIYKELHFIIKKLIHLTKEDMEKGKTFQEVISSYMDWCGRNYIFATWGTLDLIELQRNMKYYQWPSISHKPFPYLDVQKLFSIQYEDGVKRRSLEYVVDFLKIEKVKPFHRALSDAYYTAKVLEKIDYRLMKKYFSYDLYEVPKNKKDQIKQIYPTYYKFISMEYENKTIALEDEEIVNNDCYLCHRRTKEEISWFSTNGKHYYHIAVCAKHGYIKSKIRIKKTNNKRIFIVKTMKKVSNKVVEEIRERNNKVES